MAGGFFAIRGSRSLTKEEYASHLALAIRLENVAVLLGAGASKAVGGHLMTDIWRNFSADAAASRQWMDNNNFLSGAGTENVELLLDRLEIAAADVKRRGDNAFSDALDEHRHQLRKAVIRAAILSEDLWHEPSKALEDVSFGPHRTFVSRLIGNRQPGQAAPWVFTTNYDLAVEWTAEALGVHCANGFVGLHNRAFRPSSFDLGFRNVQARGEARFGAYNVYLGKMHGSISWYTDINADVVERAGPATWDTVDKFQNSATPNDWPGFMILPGASKFVQTTGFVYGEIIRRFTQFLSTPNACLIISGYSFGDDHINRIIISALQNPILQIIIYLPEIDRLDIYPSLTSTGTSFEPNPLLKRLLLAQFPQVTIRGYGDQALFKDFAGDLPEPAFLDQTSERARDLERLIRLGTASTPVTPGTASTPGTVV